jgi:hypothetical protein
MLEKLKNNYKTISLILIYLGIFIGCGPQGILILGGLHIFIWGTMNAKCY